MDEPVTAPKDPPTPSGSVTQKSPSERLLGVSDPKPDVEAARKRTPKPKAAPKTISFVEAKWDADETPIGYALATELAGGAE